MPAEQAKFCHWPRFMSHAWYALGLMNESADGFYEAKEQDYSQQDPPSWNDTRQGYSRKIGSYLR